MNKFIEKTDRGIMDILQILNQMKNKNDAYFAGAFNWLIYTHPPFPGSHIVYDFEKNDFKHWKISLYEPAYLFKDFKSDTYIQEKNFSYSTNYPYHVIVAKSDWINNLLDEKADPNKVSKWVDKWISWYHSNVELEREHFRSLISFYRPQQALPLF